MTTIVAPPWEEQPTVGGIVAASALPLPDVWAPLSDSLRMITGYGRDVLVGSDVVARMVNFSRNSTATYIGKDGQLKTAAANEPRFEKEGLRIEGQSTNLWPSQTGVDSFNAAPASTSLPDGTTGNIYKITPTPGTFAYVRQNFAAQSGNHTLSCFAKLDDGSMAMPPLGCGYNGGLSTKLTGVYVGNGWWRMQAALLDPFGNIGIGYHPAATETTPVWVCNFQLEALPFASSYIPTAGAAVTRAGDIVTIPWAMNINPSAVTVAMNYDLLGLGAFNQRIIEYSESVNPRYMVQMTPSGMLQSFAAAAPLSVSAAPYSARSTFAAATAPSRHAVKVSGRDVVSYITEGAARYRPTIPIGSGSVGQDPMFGHLRNLRIWHRTLTDDQLKAVA